MSSMAHREMMLEYWGWKEWWDLLWESTTCGESYTEERRQFYDLPERPTFRAFLESRVQREY